MIMTTLAQSAPDASTLFYITLLFIFLTAIITTVVTKWARDKCLKFFKGYHVTLERTRGQTIWGQLRVFSSGIEMMYDHPYVDPRGRKKTSYLIYGQEIDAMVLSLLRYEAELDDEQKAQRRRQIERTFNPGFFRRIWRNIRNFINTLRDAFNAAIGAAVGQFQRMNPTSAVLSSQAGSVTQISQTLLGKFANAYEPLLEQYIGQPVILDVVDPINPNNVVNTYTGYLADYTQQFIAVFSRDHQSAQTVEVTLPDVERGDPLPPLPGPPPPGATAPVLPAPLKVEHDLAIRVDGLRIKVQNTRHDPMVIRQLIREGFEPLELGCVIAPSATLDLPARDARGGRLVVEQVRCVDVVAPRKYAMIRHAGELVERKRLLDDLGLDRLPLIPKFMGKEHAGKARDQTLRDP